MSTSFADFIYELRRRIDYNKGHRVEMPITSALEEVVKEFHANFTSLAEEQYRLKAKAKADDDEIPF